ncbi:oxidoreductase [Candidatus Mancarchaeum acidiphilum]|uniref:Oxidoreductase n=2 Tax=Candidatus Mancarchaeum acidiphilum TaxID=1920749 RepID=A0A218NND7_9ARCH|nr:oxidoreductase [Candidatus Mancarchaeum acidiphilum]
MTSMAYRIASIGDGHWFSRLYPSLQKKQGIELYKISGLSRYEKKKEFLSSLGIDESRYYSVTPNAPLPDDFFEGADVVYVSDPNEFHAAHIIDALSHGKKVAVEKAIATNAEDYQHVIEYIKSNNLEGKFYLHLHYAYKILTLNLSLLLEKYTTKYGKVISSRSVFFENENEEDSRRAAWLFGLGNGGIFLDWIHPFEIYLKGALADKISLDSCTSYAVNQGYHESLPTGLHEVVSMGGRFFSEGFKADVYIAKGVKSALAHKFVDFIFNNGYTLRLDYVNSDVEFTSMYKGVWTLYDDKMMVLESGNPVGKNTAEIFADKLYDLCQGNRMDFSLEDANFIFSPYWAYLEKFSDSPIVKDNKEITHFLEYPLATYLEPMHAKA